MNRSDIYKKIRGKEQEAVGKPELLTKFTTQYLMGMRNTIEANRIFKTKKHMIAYIEDRIKDDGTISDVIADDTIKSALPGLILTVIDDDEDPNNNGMYYIENADTETTPGLVAKKIGPMTNDEIQQAFDEGTAEVNNQEEASKNELQ